MSKNNEYFETENATIDLDRQRRCGFPEVIYGESKTAEAIVEIATELFKRGVDVLATRVSEEKADYALPRLRRVCPKAYYNAVARTLRAPQNESGTSMYVGRVVVVTAGTSVAGPQRLQAKLPRLQDADAIVVVAGMEGALPSVVGGYVSAPIVAVPTSVGYGAAFGGLAALLGMMNSCASNVTVVNIDAGFKAGYVAGLISKRISDFAETSYKEGVEDAKGNKIFGRKKYDR